MQLIEKETAVVLGSSETIRFEWTTDSFCERTGMKCREFCRNYHTAPDFVGEVK